jgi:hypothetical protein
MATSSWLGDPSQNARTSTASAGSNECQELLGVSQLEIPPLGTVELQLDEENQTLKIIGECRFAIARRRGYLLLPIVNQGVTFTPPTEHLGEKLPQNDAILVAEKGLAFYEDFVTKAEEEFFLPPPDPDRLAQ